MSTLTRRALRVVLGLGACALVHGTAHAEETAETVPATASEPASAASTGDDGRARAQALFESAVELASGGNFEAACKKLEQSVKLHDGIGTSFHLAGCWQKIGRTASASRLFEKVAGRAHELGQVEREQAARARLEALGPKLSRLRIDVESRGPRTEVYRDGEIVPESDWRRAVPVDRGTHELRVTAAGKEPWSTRLEVDSPGTTVAVLVPPLADVPARAAAPEVQKQQAPLRRAARPPAPKQAPTSGNGQRVLALALGGVGAAAVAFGAIEGVQYLNDNREAKGLCPSSRNCSRDEIVRHDAAVNDAKRERTWAFVGVGVGGALIATASYLFFSASSSAEPADERRSAGGFGVDPLLDGDGAIGAALHGRF